MGRAIAPWMALLLLASVCAAASEQTPAKPRRVPRLGSSVWRLRPDAPSLTVREPRVALQSVSPRELMVALQQPAAAAGMSISAGVPDAVFPGTLRIQRRLESVWTLRLPATDADPGSALDVAAEVVAPSGETNRLRGAGAAAAIAVRAVPLPPRLVSREADAATYEGGVMLEIDLSGARTSGTYSGTLVLTVNQF